MLFPSTLVAERYRTDSLLGRGGMGEVWKCFDTNLNRDVVIKTVNPELTKARPQHTSIFIDEGRIGASLVGHPNVVSVFDIINSQNDLNPTLAIAMEYVGGMSCAAWIENGSKQVDPKTKHIMNLMIAMESCKAITYAHRQSILHRDIKPLNIFISKYGISKIGDFGIARYADAVTREHTVWNFRSPAYSAPEQWKDEKSTTATDIYQLGCTLYHLFTGAVPFESSSVAALIQKHLTSEPADPQSINSEISQSLAAVIQRCLSKEKSKRPSLWEVTDAIAHDLQHKYSINIAFDKNNAELIKKISGITDFNDDSLRKDGAFSWDFEDHNEAISEAFELVFLSDVKVTLKKTAVPGERKQASTSSANSGT